MKVTISITIYDEKHVAKGLRNLAQQYTDTRGIPSRRTCSLYDFNGKSIGYAQIEVSPESKGTP